MQLPTHKTSIICTIGPASSAVDILVELIHAGMSVARINLSHGNPDEWRERIRNINEASRRTGRIIEILADLPGAKIRLGKLQKEPVILRKGAKVTLTTEDIPGTEQRLPVQYRELTESVKAGSTIFLHDGFVELKVDRVEGTEVHCTVLMGSSVVSHHGVNLPGAQLFMEAITDKDLALVDFALRNGITTFGVSFVEKAGDILKVKDIAKKAGKPVHAVAKIERRQAVDNIEEILSVADGVMIARGDLGVEMPIQEVPEIQKRIIASATLLGKPVIIATQMLESMKSSSRPTRAEVSDVANAILDGTDAIMLSEETAMGQFPVETVRMMASIAVTTESERTSLRAPENELRWYLKALAEKGKLTIPDVISRNAVVAAGVLNARYIVTPTDTGSTPHRLSRYKPDAWILAFSRFEQTCRFLTLSYGVYPFRLDHMPQRRYEPIMKYLDENKLIEKGDRLVVTEGRLPNQPGGTNTLEIITV